MILRFALFLGLLTFFSCSKQETGDFKLEYRMRIELDAAANPLLTHVYQQRLPSAWVSFLLANNLDNEDIRLIRPREVFISPVLDPEISYKLFAEAHVSLFDPSDPLNKLYIGDIYDNIEDREELFLLPGLADVKELIMLPEFVLQLEMNLRSVPGRVSEHFVVVQFDVFLK
ncbi:MAG: hypothetical protein IPM34_03660 [Saprospiraceae bacterium]|nr:hypothetical protein [Saprospiraceae bacterium]